MFFNQKDNPIIKTLIEVLQQNLATVTMSGHIYNGPTESIYIKFKTDKEYDIRLTEHISAFGDFRIYDSVSKKEFKIRKDEYKSIKAAIEDRDDNILLNEMKKLLEMNQNKVLEEGKKLTQDVST